MPERDSDSCVDCFKTWPLSSIMPRTGPVIAAVANAMSVQHTTVRNRAARKHWTKFEHERVKSDWQLQTKQRVLMSRLMEAAITVACQRCHTSVQTQFARKPAPLKRQQKQKTPFRTCDCALRLSNLPESCRRRSTLQKRKTRLRV